MSDEVSKKWQELPIGGVILDAGNTVSYNTGTWRVQRPVWKKDSCTNCLICWSSCPDSAISARDGKFAGFNYTHCKGCGICSVECPTKPKSIDMVKEPDMVFDNK